MLPCRNWCVSTEIVVVSVVSEVVLVDEVDSVVPGESVVEVEYEDSTDIIAVVVVGSIVEDSMTDGASECAGSDVPDSQAAIQSGLEF